DAGEDSSRPALAPAEFNGTPDEHLARLGAAPVVVLSGEQAATPDDDREPAIAPVPPLLLNLRDPEPTQELRRFIHDFGGRILFAAEAAGRREMLADLLRQENVRAGVAEGWQEFLAAPEPVMLTVAPLEEGLILKRHELAIITERELFGERTRKRRRQRRVRDPEQIISDLTDLSAGAPIVHIDHGVGRYRGLTMITIDGMPTEFLTVEYAGGDLLHVPVASLHLISRYSGSTPEQAPLHRLGSDQWDKAR